MELYVVMSGLPGPGAEALLEEALGGSIDPNIGAVLARACEFVELENGSGAGQGEATTGVRWEPHPVGEGLYRLGPFARVADVERANAAKHSLAGETLQLADEILRLDSDDVPDDMRPGSVSVRTAEIVRERYDASTTTLLPCYHR